VRYVGTLVLLASLPAFPSASHDPTYWMDQLMAVANKSPYQKILSWSPLLELVSVRMGGRESGEEGTREGGMVKVREDVTVEVVLKSHAPKPMKNVIVVLTLVTRVEASSEQRMSTSSLEPTSPLSPAHPTSPLEDLDLDMESCSQPRSRPIGHFTKARTSSSTHFSSSTIVEMEGRGQRNTKQLLSTILPSLSPGQTTVSITGQLRQEGVYFPEKVSVKCGSLDFVISEPSPRGWWERPLVVSKKTEDITISLVPQLGIFFAGCPQACTLTFETGADITIPQDSTVSLMMSSDVTISCPGGCVSEDGGGRERKVVATLPVVLPSSSHSLPLHLTFPFLPSLSHSTPSKEATYRTHHYHLVVHLEGHHEPLRARISVPVCQPLTLTHCEHSAGESTYLQLSLENTSPAPLLLRSPSLTSDLVTTQLHTELPQALAPGGNFSCIWQTQPGSRRIGDNGEATFTLQYKPLIAGQDTSHVDMSYAFPVSNMQTIFHSQLFVEGLREGSGRLALLKYVVHNVATALPHSHLPAQLHYSITDPSALWKIQDSPTGVLNTPAAGKSGQICIQAVPKKSGSIAPPRLTLSVPRVGAKVKESESNIVVLTPAQVYELSLGETVTVG
jgi:hypothetical protein